MMSSQVEAMSRKNEFDALVRNTGNNEYV